jgi:hypothetical protein
MWSDSRGSECSKMAVSSECSNEHSGPWKARNFLTRWANYEHLKKVCALLKEDICTLSVYRSRWNPSPRVAFTRGHNDMYVVLAWISVVEALCSIIGWRTEYPDLGFSWFSSAHPDDITSKQTINSPLSPLPYSPFYFFPIGHVLASCHSKESLQLTHSR